MKQTLLYLAMALILLAAISSVALLASDSKILEVPGRRAAVISALPLLAVGFSFLILQPILRPKWAELFKNLLLAATFLLWGAVQLMTRNVASKTLGDVVIALYVTDLAWTILARVRVMGKTVD
jgi:hypothetical protein